MVCPKCGKETSSKKFCTQCGENIEELIKEENKKKKEGRKEKTEKIKVRIAIVLFIIFVLLLATVIGLNFYFANKNFGEFKKKEILEEEEAKIVDDSIIIDEVDLYEFELTDENKDQDYDKDGLTNEEEVNLGTDPINEDSDDDGISDGDEVNRYKTDPLKWSTSDDGISDFVKISKDLEISKVYKEYEIKPEEVEITSDITLVPDDLESEVKGVFKEFSNDNTINSYKRVFSVYDFKGKINYTLQDTDVVLLTVYNGKYTEFDDYAIKGKVMTIVIDEDDNAKDFVIVTKENYKKYQKGGENDEETY